MPELNGLSLRQASEALAAAGLVCRAERSGPHVIRQEPDPGAPVSGGRCAIFF
jgi:beta-lactam-binding protein with PASTA domain